MKAEHLILGGLILLAVTKRNSSSQPPGFGIAKGSVAYEQAAENPLVSGNYSNEKAIFDAVSSATTARGALEAAAQAANQQRDELIASMREVDARSAGAELLPYDQSKITGANANVVKSKEPIYGSARELELARKQLAAYQSKAAGSSGERSAYYRELADQEADRINRFVVR